ncbi:glycosyl hydrolase [Aureococcus anophagefferens]|nr:glycosyl hydrolase [Aureococcus anophagefferens]
MTDALGRFYWNPDCFAKGLVAWAKSFVPDKYPFYVTEYNVAVGENDVAHDTSTAAAFLAHDRRARRRLETISGIAKPAFRAFQLLHEHAGPHRVAATVSSSGDAAADGGACRLTEDLGCWDQDVARDGGCLPSVDDAGGPFPATTPETCAAFCYARGAADSGAAPGAYGGAVRYVGLEAGRECWCSSVGVADEARCPRADDSDCDAPCVGDASQRCGGTWRLRLYAVDCDPPPPPPPTRTVDAFATRDGAKVAVFLSNWDARLPPQGWSDAPAPTTAVTVAGVSGDLELYRIDEEHANPRARWLAMGAPAVPSTSQLAELRDASRVAAEVVTLDAGAVALEMPANAAYLLVGAAA